MAKTDPIEPSEIHEYSIEELRNKFREAVIEKARINVEYKELLKKHAKYIPMEIQLGTGDYWNIFVKHISDIVYIVQKAPGWLRLLVNIIKVVELIKGSIMKGKWFDTVTTILGLLWFVWEGVYPVLSGSDFSWERLISAAITAILAYFTQPKTVIKNIKNAMTFRKVA